MSQQLLQMLYVLPSMLIILKSHKIGDNSLPQHWHLWMNVLFLHIIIPPTPLPDYIIVYFAMPDYISNIFAFLEGFRV
jgi:hypothetical protein